MNIAGILLHAKPKQLEIVKQQLTPMSGVEIHAVTEDGRLVVTVENDNEDIITERILTLHQCEGVLSVAMVYQYGDDGDEESGTDI